MRARDALLLVVAFIALIGCAPGDPAGWTFATNSPTAASITAATPPATGVVPTASPNAIANTQTVTSELHGWTVEIPAAWRYRAATEVWPADTYPTAGAVYTDILSAPITTPTFDVTTRPLTAEETQESFLAWLDTENEAHGYIADEESEIAVDGTTARLQHQPFHGENIWEVAAFHEGRVYLMYWIGLDANRNVEEPIFRQLVESFRFPN